MGISTAINNSLLPQSLVAIQNFLKQDAEARKEEEKRKRITETAGEITKMFSSLPDNATVEQINNVSKQAMMYAFKQDTQESLSVIGPLNKMAQGELQQRNELQTSQIMSKYLGITDKDIAKLPVQTMVEAMKFSESLNKAYEMKDTEGRTHHRAYNSKNELISDIVLDPTTTQQRMSQQIQLAGEETKARVIAEKEYGYHPDQGKYSYVGTQNGMGVVMDVKTGQLNTSNIPMDQKTQTQLKLGSLNQEVNARAMDFISRLMEVDDDVAEKLQERQKSTKNEFDPTVYISELYSKGYVEKAKRKGIISDVYENAYWDAKKEREKTLSKLNEILSDDVSKKAKKGNSKALGW